LQTTAWDDHCITKSLRLEGGCQFPNSGERWPEKGINKNKIKIKYLKKNLDLNSANCKP